MRCETLESSDPSIQSPSEYHIPATSANSTPPLSCPLCASHELLQLADIVMQVFLFRTLVPCSRPGDNQHRNQPQPIRISVPLYIFFTHSILVLIRGWRTLVGGWVASPPRFTSSRFMPTLYVSGWTFGSQLATGKKRGVIYSAVLLMTDSSLFSRVPILFTKTPILAPE